MLFGLPPSTAYSLTLCNPASVLKAINLKSVLPMATSSWAAHFPVCHPLFKPILDQSAAFESTYTPFFMDVCALLAAWI